MKLVQIKLKKLVIVKNSLSRLNIIVVARLSSRDNFQSTTVQLRMHNVGVTSIFCARITYDKVLCWQSWLTSASRHMLFVFNTIFCDPIMLAQMYFCVHHYLNNKQNRNDKPMPPRQAPLKIHSCVKFFFEISKSNQGRLGSMLFYETWSEVSTVHCLVNFISLKHTIWNQNQWLHYWT